MTDEHKNDAFLEKVILFLVVLVGAILILTQYQFSKILRSYWSYAGFILIFALIGLVAWMFIEKKPKSGIEIRHHKTAEHSHPLTFMEKLNYGIVAIVAALILFNQMQISQVTALAGLNSPLTLKTASTKTSVALTGDPAQDAMAIIIPRGTPFYGEALGVSFEDPIRSLEIIAQLDPSYGRNRVQLSPEEKARYIQIGTTPSIACEFCCGATTLVSKDGRPACGCKHSWAMRGLAAYLIKNYPKLSDEEIVREVAKWKGLFFPKNMIQKYLQQSQTGKYTPDIAALLLNADEAKLKEMKQAVASQKSQSSGQVPASVNDLPSMVGGC